MTDPQPEKRGKGAGFWTVAVLLALPVLYVLSTGPMWWMVCHRHLEMDTYKELWQTLYLPIRWLSTQSETAMSVLHWYLKLWSETYVP